MQAAKEAGYMSLLGVVVLVPCALAFRWMAQVSAAAFVPVIPFMCMALFWLLMLISVVYAFYAVWGLACGYNTGAWQAYERMQAEATKKIILAECLKMGIEPPSWLE